MQIIRHFRPTVNLHPAERWASTLTGCAAVVSGIRQGKSSGFLRVAGGGLLIHRGITGHCGAYELLGLTTAPTRATLPYELGVRARAAVTIAAPREKVFEFWQDLENLPRFMRHLISVEMLDEKKKSRWTARGPLDRKVTWDAETINEIPGQLIAWKSLPGSEVDSAGSVRFRQAPGYRGTEVRVELQYNPPAGIIGAYTASLFGREPEQEIAADLGRLKQFLESGEVASTEGQPQGGRPTDRVVSRILEEAIP
jgi:uncharacterized membrane protein